MKQELQKYIDELYSYRLKTCCMGQLRLTCFQGYSEWWHGHISYITNTYLTSSFVKRRGFYQQTTKLSEVNFNVRRQ